MIQGCLKCNEIFDDIFISDVCPNCYSDKVVDLHELLKERSEESFELDFNEDKIDYREE